MSAIGMNVAADGRHGSDALRALHCTWARIVARRDTDISAALYDYRANGIGVLLVLDRLSIEAYGSVDGERLAATAELASARAALADTRTEAPQRG